VLPELTRILYPFCTLWVPINRLDLSDRVFGTHTVLSGLINTAFIHEGPHGYAGSGLFGSGGQSYQAVIDLLDASIASLDRIEVEIRKSRRNPLYWGDRVLRALLGIPRT